MTVFNCTMHAVTESDPLSALRGEITRRREELGLNYVDAAKRAGITSAWWSSVERGHEVKGGKQVRVDPSRKAVIKMARAVGWSPGEALTLAGMAPLSVVESQRQTGDPRDELARLAKGLTDQRVLALLYVARAMDDPQALIPADGPPAGPDPNTEHLSTVIETPQEPSTEAPAPEPANGPQ